MDKDFSREYASALYSLAVDEGISKDIFNELNQVSDIYSENPEFVRLLNNPRLSAIERANTVGNVFSGKCNVFLVNFLKIIAEKRRSEIIPKCFEIYKKMYCEDNGILPVTVSSAAPLTEEQRARLIETLSKKTGKEILLSSRIDPSCIGGLSVEYSGKRFDSSVKGRLEGMLRNLS